jgi:hypothetical protein
VSRGKADRGVIGLLLLRAAEQRDALPANDDGK